MKPKGTEVSESRVITESNVDSDGSSDHFGIRKGATGQVAQVVGASSHTPKVCGFEP